MRRIETEEYKAILTNILVKVDQLCRDNDIPYMIFYGTLLGAVRHHGFIPWDDDVDIVIKRQDLKRLQDVVNQHSSELGINFIYIDTNPDTIFICAKICDTSTVLNEVGFRQIKGYGAFIDVFPIDNLAEQRMIRKIRSFVGFKKRQIITHSSMTTWTKSASIFRNIMRCIAFYSTRGVHTGRMIQKMNNACQKYNYLETTYVGLPYSKKTIFQRDWFQEVTELEFEGHRFFAPKCYDVILRQLYGDYMKLPPVEKQISNHNFECYTLEKSR